MAKNALCMGINDYPGTDMDLRGCVNDAHDWEEMLTRRGFKVTKLLDGQATKQAMVAAIGTIIGSAAAGDTVVITYSGHGTYQPDLDGDEADGLDEALCPHDIRTNGQALLDDEIRQLFNTRKAGVKLVFISDSCHSGTVTRAAPAEPDAEGPRPRFLPMGNWLPPERLPKSAGGATPINLAVKPGLSPFTGVLLKQEGDLLLSGCQEGPNNFSFDAQISGKPNGAFTYYALKTLKSLPPNATYADWHKKIAEYLPSASYPQSPQIVGNAQARKQKIFA